MHSCSALKKKAEHLLCADIVKICKFIYYKNTLS